MKTGIQIIFLPPAPEQGFVSLRNNGLFLRNDNGFHLSVDFVNATVADQSTGINGIQPAYIYRHWFSAGLSFYLLVHQVK